jgi:hypothetical protein
MKRIETSQEDAAKILGWLNAGRGAALWGCADLGCPSKTWTTPARKTDGTPMEKQNWQMNDAPSLVVESAEDVTVYIDKEVKRFHVGVKRGCGFTFECTSAASKRIRKETEKAGPKAYHVFDYAFQDAVIMAPDSEMSLADWAKANPQA